MIDNIYNNYINTGYVHDDIIKVIAIKLSKSEVLTEREFVIFGGETGRVNEMVVKIYKEQNEY